MNFKKILTFFPMSFLMCSSFSNVQFAIWSGIKYYWLTMVKFDTAIYSKSNKIYHKM